MELIPKDSTLDQNPAQDKHIITSDKEVWLNIVTLVVDQVNKQA